jgi:hypothetical protein
MKKLFLTIGLAGLLMGPAQPIKATTYPVQPETNAAAGLTLLLVLGTGFSKIAGHYGVTNALGVGGALLGGGAVGYIVKSICASTIMESLWPWAFVNPVATAWGGGILASIILGVLLTDSRVKESSNFKRGAKLLSRAALTLGIVAGASYIMNKNGKALPNSLRDLEPIKDIQ